MCTQPTPHLVNVRLLAYANLRAQANNVALGCQRTNGQKVVSHVGEPEPVILGVVVMHQMVPQQRLETPIRATMPVMW